MAMSMGLQSIMGRIPAVMRRYLLGDARAELSNTVSDRIVVGNDALIHIESSRSAPLVANARAEQIAQTVKNLLGEASANSNIELLLAPSEFVATSQSMPGVNADNLESAILLQRDSLLPALDEPLSMAISTSTNANLDNDVVALWLPSKRLQELFAAFAQHELNLIAVLPRILGKTHNLETEVAELIEEDEEHVTAVRLQNGSLLTWLQLDKSDLTQSDFANQWESETATFTSAVLTDATDLDAYPNERSTGKDYLFFPQGALDAHKRVEKGRQLLIAASLAVGLMLLSSTPFIFQSIEFRMANSRLDATREMSADARTDQGIVVNFENQWGAINDYPDQQLRAAMFRLQEVLGNEQLSSLELSEGLIRIQGTSADPQAILQRLEQDPMFTEVVFSRATNNTRYYIDLRLATVSFEAYMVRYFPDAS